ncbi:MAG TPA: hypothetical protein VE201_10430 [Nitrospirales bacterium]|jgi:hypothetical protein|nr:hypothetical protein [Nitrospirales bacterium]
MADKTDPTIYKYDVKLANGPFREPEAPALSYDFFVNRKGWLIPRVMRVWVDIKGELELFQHQILGVSGGSPGQQLKLTQFLTRKIADQKAQLILEEGRMEKSSEVLVKGFTETDVHLFPRLEAWMREVKDRVREEIRTQIGL